jgi:hypothetical protein
VLIKTNNNKMDISKVGKGYKKERFKLKHLFRKRLDVYGKYLTANPVDVLAIAKMFPVKNQGSSGSCGGQAWAAYIETLKYLRDNGIVPVSAHDIYSHSWTPPEGAAEGDLIKDVENNGAAFESDIPSYPSPGVAPTEAFMEYQVARVGQAVDNAYGQIVYDPITFGGDINSIKQAITLGNGCVIAVYGDNQGWQTANVDPPQSKNWGHWLFCCSYSDSLKVVTVKNSWGTDVGDGGYFYIPYSYFTNGNVMGGWIFQLRPAGYYVGLLQTIVNLMKNIIGLIVKK